LCHDGYINTTDRPKEHDMNCTGCGTTDPEYIGWNGQGDGDGYSLCCNEPIAQA
jgi:hypothetical protein